MLKSSLLVPAAMVIAAVCLPITSRNAQAKARAQAGATPQTTPSAPSAPVAANPVKPTPESQAKARAIYKRDCALCHGENGNGKGDLAKDMNLPLDDWTQPQALAGKLDGDLFAAIRNGKGQMPAEDPGRADDTQVWNLIHYLRGMSKAQAPAAATH